MRSQELERLILEQIAEARGVDSRIDSLVNELETLAREKRDPRALTGALWALAKKHDLHLDMVKAVASLVESAAQLRRGSYECPAKDGGALPENCPIILRLLDDNEEFNETPDKKQGPRARGAKGED